MGKLFSLSPRKRAPRCEVPNCPHTQTACEPTACPRVLGARTIVLDECGQLLGSRVVVIDTIIGQHAGVTVANEPSLGGVKVERCVGTDRTLALPIPSSRTRHDLNLR